MTIPEIFLCTIIEMGLRQIKDLGLISIKKANLYYQSGKRVLI
jgi:hypothetical protein